jgi:hypothetical protein
MSNYPFIKETEQLVALYTEMKATYEKQVLQWLSMNVANLHNYRDATYEQLMSMFDRHIHRYQQAFLFFNNFDLVDCAYGNMHIESIFIQPGHHTDMKVATLSQDNDVFELGFKSSLETNPYLDHDHVCTRIYLPLRVVDTLPYPTGSYVITTMDAETESVLCVTDSEGQVLSLVWSPLVSHMLHSDSSVLN